MLPSATLIQSTYLGAIPLDRLTDARVLVVDDTEAQLYAVARALRGDGFEVVEARSGEEALTLATATPFDVVVLDVNLPDIDGFEVCRRLKQASAFFMVPRAVRPRRNLG